MEKALNCLNDIRNRWEILEYSDFTYTKSDSNSFTVILSGSDLLVKIIDVSGLLLTNNHKCCDPSRSSCFQRSLRDKLLQIILIDQIWLASHFKQFLEVFNYILTLNLVRPCEFNGFLNCCDILLLTGIHANELSWTLYCQWRSLNIILTNKFGNFILQICFLTFELIWVFFNQS